MRGRKRGETRKGRRKVRREKRKEKGGGMGESGRGEEKEEGKQTEGNGKKRLKGCIMWG